jgi:hypothetical protein
MKSRSYAVFLQPPTISSQFGPNIILSTRSQACLFSLGFGIALLIVYDYNK